MAQVETKQAEKDALSKEPPVKNIAAPAEIVADKATSEPQPAEEKKDPEEKDSDEKAEETSKENKPDEAPSAKPNDVSAHAASKNVQEGRAWNNRDQDRGPRGRGWGGRNGRGGRGDYKGNIKSDLTSQEESSDPVAIRKQVQCTPTRVTLSC